MNHQDMPPSGKKGKPAVAYLKIGKYRLPYPALKPATYQRIIWRGMAPPFAAWFLCQIPLPGLLKAVLLFALGLFFFRSLLLFINDLDTYIKNAKN